MALHLLRRLQTSGRVIGTVGTEAKVGFLLSNTQLGREQIIVRTTGAYARANTSVWIQQFPILMDVFIIAGSDFGGQLDGALRSMGKEGIDVSMDSLLGDWFKRTMDRLNARGRVCVFGAGSMSSASDKPNWPGRFLLFCFCCCYACIVIVCLCVCVCVCVRVSVLLYLFICCWQC